MAKNDLEQRMIEMGNKYVITAAQANAPVNEEFYRSLLTYCEVNEAKLMVIPLQGRHISEEDINPVLEQYVIGRGDHSLGKNIKVSDWVIKPQQMLPLTGLGRFTASDVSSIFGSPKQHLQVVPNSNESLPKVLMSTGVVTKPNYNDKFRIGQIAKKDHTYGAITVEVEKGGGYHFRQLNSLVNGKFFDLGVLYDGETYSSDFPEALVLGDVHALDQDPRVFKANLRMIEDLRPDRIFLHDLFDGYSINHWNQGKIVELHKDWEKSGLNLEYELSKTGETLMKYAEVTPDTEVVVVASNHDERLHRYLQEGRFIDEPQNVKIGSELLTSYLEGENPLEAGLRMYYDLPDNITFLGRDDDYKVRGFQLGAHGDKGSNGSRGSPRGMELAYGKSISAHSHTPMILRNTYKVGTSTPLRLRYTQGASSWMNSNALLYSNGKVQIVNVMRGKYSMGDKK